MSIQNINPVKLQKTLSNRYAGFFKNVKVYSVHGILSVVIRPWKKIGENLYSCERILKCEFAWDHGNMRTILNVLDANKFVSSEEARALKHMKTACAKLSFV